MLPIAINELNDFHIHRVWSIQIQMLKTWEGQGGLWGPGVYQFAIFSHILYDNHSDFSSKNNFWWFIFSFYEDKNKLWLPIIHFQKLKDLWRW